MMNRLKNLAKSKKFWIPAGTIGALLTALGYARRDKEEPQIEEQPTLQTQAQQTKPTGKVSPQAPTTELQTQDQNIVGAFIPELLRLYQLSNALAVQYEQDANAYYQIYQEYEKKLEELLPAIVVEMMKTPISQMTGADLPSKISTLFRYYSWEFAVENFPKILKGYYMVKMHDKDQDTSNLTINDLIAVAENPALAQNENMVRLFELIGEHYKLKMQNALGQIGKLKDIYAYKLNTLKEQANMIKEMVKAILDQEALNFERQYKIATLNQKERQFNEMMRWRWAQYGLAKQKLEQGLNAVPLIQINKED